MDATALGTLLLGIGGVLGAAVAYVGKRGENTTTRLNAEIDQVQEERDGLRVLLQARDARIAELLQERLADQVELARLRIRIIERGEQP